MLVLPSDHVISPREVFQESVRRASQLVSQHPESLVLFGIRPTFLRLASDISSVVKPSKSTITPSTVCSHSTKSPTC